MTKTYMINAWCLRPFITGIDVEAETPEQAIAIARSEQDKLLGGAEECTPAYAWDEFAVYDESGCELLHELDQEPRLRRAAPNLLEALKNLAEQADEDCPAGYRTRHFTDALGQAHAVIAEATAQQPERRPA